MLYSSFFHAYCLVNNTVALREIQWSGPPVCIYRRDNYEAVCLPAYDLVILNLILNFIH